jgi:hypothetical protein
MNSSITKRCPGANKVFIVQGVPVGPEERIRSLKDKNRIDKFGVVTIYCMALIPTDNGFRAENCFVQDFVNHQEKFMIVSYRRDLGDVILGSTAERSVDLAEHPRVPWMDRSESGALNELDDMVQSPYADEDEAFQRKLYELFQKTPESE